MRFLTPTLGPNSSAIATRSRWIRRTDALPRPRLTGDVDGLRRQLEHLIAVSDPIDVATPLATLAGTVMVVGVPAKACWRAAFAEPPPTTPASRR